MNQHINRIIAEIMTKDPVLDLILKKFENASYYNKYFTGIDLSPDELSPSVNAELRRTMNLALENIASTKKALFIIWLIITPVTIFLGSVLRDYFLSSIIVDYPGSFGHFLQVSIIFLSWIGFFIFLPLAFSLENYLYFSSIKNYLKLHSIEKPISNNELNELININNDKSSKSRLTELEILLTDKLISEDEYKLKKKEILKDL
jgi:hypothetical protein